MSLKDFSLDGVSNHPVLSASVLEEQRDIVHEFFELNHRFREDVMAHARTRLEPGSREYQVQDECLLILEELAVLSARSSLPGIYENGEANFVLAAFMAGKYDGIVRKSPEFLALRTVNAPATR